MKDDLTNSEKLLASAQGWQLVYVYDTAGYWAWAILPTTQSPHADAFAARAFVWARAKAGDNLAKRALSLTAAAELARPKGKK